MTVITEKSVKINGFRFHFVPTKKFKTLTIAAKLRAPLEAETITKRALLPNILRQATKNYPTRQELQLKLDDLYGAVLSIGGTKKGEQHIISVRMEIANERYLPKGAEFVEEAAQLFEELIFQPYEENGLFSEKIFRREKETLKQRIQSIKDDKIRYANMRLIDEMCKDEAFSLHVNGYESELETLTNQELFDYYQKMINEDLIDLYVVGDFEPAAMEEKLTKVFNKTRNEKNTKPVASKNREIEDVKEIIENEPIQQAKLHIGYRTNTVYSDDDYPALQVFNGIFGGFPSSKLFINVREKNSLAYYASSQVESHKGLLFVYSGIAPEDYEKARDIIREQMDEMKAGNFTEDEIAEAKKMIIHYLREAMDSNYGLVEIFHQQHLAGTSMNLQELFDRINAVTKEDIIGIATKIQEDTLYLLTPKGGENNE
ncbi:EF-P 5-aminopentanol modification-associated protein YfmF [Oceanobacillus sp. CAU 1775]